MSKEITFNILKSACEYNGQSWKDGDNCNHHLYSYSGSSEGYGEDAGYIIRSDEACMENICPFIKGLKDK